MYFTEDGELSENFNDVECLFSSNKTNKKVKLEELHFQLPNQENIKQFQLLNQTTLPCQYSKSFYMRVLKMEIDEKSYYWTRIAFYGTALVGAICCLFEKLKSENGDLIGQRINILTLATLPTFRQRGIATHLMNLLMVECQRAAPPILSIHLHVQSNNEIALEFYKRFGFKVVTRLENYYKRISPADAFLLERNL